MSTSETVTPTAQTRTALELLKLVVPELADSFSGLGVVFYHSLSALPFVALDVADPSSFGLPVYGLEPTANVLAKTAQKTSPWHDGFHFMHVGSLGLTHLCQFVAPPLPLLPDINLRARGARHMTALLASRVKGVEAVGLLTQDLIVSIYEFGELRVSRSLA